MKRRFFPYAFIKKNYRELSFERQVVFWSNLILFSSCFFPWVSYQPMYGRLIHFNAFAGNTWFMGFLIAAISLGTLFFLVEALLDTRWVNLKISQNSLLFIAGIQSLVLLLCIWSVMSASSAYYSETRIGFGYFISLVMQLANITALFLESQGEKRQMVMDFFTKKN